MPQLPPLGPGNGHPLPHALNSLKNCPRPLQIWPKICKTIPVSKHRYICAFGTQIALCRVPQVRGPHGQVFVRGVKVRGPHGQVFVRGVEISLPRPGKPSLMGGSGRSSWGSHRREQIIGQKHPCLFILHQPDHPIGRCNRRTEDRRVHRFAQVDALAFAARLHL